MEKKTEIKSKEEMAEQYTEEEYIEYEIKHPFPKEVPMDARERLMNIFKEQCIKNFMAGFDAHSQYRNQTETLPEGKAVDVWVWIKCSDRLPDKQHNYHVRVKYEDDKTECWNTGSVWNMSYWEHPSQYDTNGLPKKLKVYEWLIN